MNTSLHITHDPTPGGNRYVPTGTRVVPGIRGAFDKDYKFTPVSGRGSHATKPEHLFSLAQASSHQNRGGGLATIPDAEQRNVLYGPCFGNAVRDLKK